MGTMPYRSSHPEGFWGIITEGNCGLELWRYSRHMRVRYDRDPTPCKAVFVSERFDRSQARALPYELPTVGEFQESLDRTAASLRSAGLEVEGLYFSKLADQFGERTMPNTDYVDIIPPSIKGMGRLMLGLSIASLNAIYGFEAKVLECSEAVEASTQLWEASFNVLMNQANSVSQLKQAA